MRFSIFKWNDISLREKMLMSFLVFMLIPMLIVGSYLVQELRSQTLDEASRLASESVARLKLRMSELLGSSVKISDRISVDPQLAAIANTQYSSVLEVFKAYRDLSTLPLMKELCPEVSGIKLYVENPSLIDNWEFRPVTPDVRSMFWYKEAFEGRGRIGWFFWADSSRLYRSHLSLVRLFPFYGYETQCVMVLDINTDLLDDILSREGFETMLLDRYNSVVSSNNRSLIGKHLEDRRIISLLAGGSPGSREESYRGKKYQVYVEEIRSDISFTPLRIVTIVSVDSIMRTANRISRTGVLALLGMSVIAVFFLLFIFSVFATRIQKLSRQVSQVAQGHFHSELPVDGLDEIGQLTSQFNQMVISIRDLMEEVRTSNEQKATLEIRQNEIRLKMLASQINPHFLFNVLESIRMRSILKGEKEIAQAVKLLGKLMRKNLEATGNRITVVEELERVRYFLDIEKFRMENQLEYFFRIDPRAEAILIPPLIIEPLVENAVVHGLEMKQGGGRLELSIQVKDEWMELVLADNGLGIEAESLVRLRESLDLPSGEHVGLKNVHQRLCLMYGEESGLMIESLKGMGTTVRFRIPLAVSGGE